MSHSLALETSSKDKHTFEVVDSLIHQYRLTERRALSTPEEVTQFLQVARLLVEGQRLAHCRRRSILRIFLLGRRHLYACSLLNQVPRDRAFRVLVDVLPLSEPVTTRRTATTRPRPNPQVEHPVNGPHDRSLASVVRQFARFLIHTRAARHVVQLLTRNDSTRKVAGQTVDVYPARPSSHPSEGIFPDLDDGRATRATSGALY